ncbi:hypothetical protein EV192_112329 [Actinocrispum wychmicini]|uniref:Uncharacterized protein n=1 Tax=Actinocrispum wychmicini TaxID=1213861 RepID=A0A4R2J4C3_9PSEU|nr:hypothetical protein EV192_112329 [Actinocrispum wychmicini]
MLSTVVGLVGRPRVRVREGWGHPGIWLLGVTAAVYVNQVLFTVYVLRVHDGDPGFIAKYLPSGWFAVAGHDPVLRWLADNFPAPDALSLSVLRVQAFLELPFVVFAVLTVCRWYGPELYRRAAGLVLPTVVFYTATFCLIEYSLKNPYTWDDIAIRIGSGIVVGLVVPKLTGPPPEKRVTSTTDLALFLLSVGAVGVLVLSVYDTALLYNLGHVHEMLPLAALAAAVLIGTRLAARRTGAAATSGTAVGPGIDMLTRTVGWFLAYFSVPALAIRYGMIFGAPRLAVVAGVVVTAAAVIRAGRETRRAVFADEPAGALAQVAARRVWAAQLVGSAVAGVAAAFLAYRTAGGYPEFRLLAAAAAFGVVVVTTCAAVDRAYWLRAYWR